MPTWLENPTMPGRDEGQVSGDLTVEDCKKKWPDHAHLNNERYSRLMGDYLTCMSVYLH